MSTFTITRRIDIDSGHRIMTHGSQCRHLHGHRYGIEATCLATGGLQEQGEQTGMVLDFGFLKEEMMRLIATPCDHGFIVGLADHELLAMLAPGIVALEWWAGQIEGEVDRHGFYATCDCRLGTKLYVIAGQPTAECLARHWFERLKPAVATRSDGAAALSRITVWETPNSRAAYGEA